MALDTDPTSVGMNAYDDVAGVTDYLTERGRGADWGALSTAEQEALIISNTDYLDNAYRGLWKGTKDLCDRETAWTRYGVYDEEGCLVDSTVVPAEIQSALAEAITRDISYADLTPDRSESSGLKREKKFVPGPTGTDREWFRGGSTIVGSTPTIYPVIDQILQGLLISGRNSLLRPATRG